MKTARGYLDRAGYLGNSFKVGIVVRIFGRGRVRLRCSPELAAKASYSIGKKVIVQYHENEVLKLVRYQGFCAFARALGFPMASTHWMRAWSLVEKFT